MLDALAELMSVIQKLIQSLFILARRTTGKINTALKTKQAPPEIVAASCGLMFSWYKAARRWPGSQCRWQLRSGLQFYTTWPAGTLPLSFSTVSHSLVCKCPPSNTPGCWGWGTPGSRKQEPEKWFSQQSLASSPLMDAILKTILGKCCTYAKVYPQNNMLNLLCTSSECI